MTLKITLLQTNPQWEAVDKNLAAVERLIAQAEGELVVMPEMFASGFSMNPSCCALSPDEAAGWFRKQATSSGKAVCSSVIVCDDDCYYNRMYFAKPCGEVMHYDKRHLFRMSGESKHYTDGNRRVVVNYKGFRILLSICYDLRFPVWLRNRCDYDLMINVASWAVPRQEVWRILLKARAIENLCYVIGVNRVGSDPTAEYGGHSAVINYRGEVMFEATEGKELSQTVELSMEELAKFKEKFPAYLDADCFTMNI